LKWGVGLLTGNKGEWSEFYAFVKLLAEGRFHAADENLNKIEGIYYPVLRIIRNELSGKTEYHRNSEVNIVNERGETIVSVPVKRFQDHAEIILERIKNEKSTFSIPEVMPFFEEIQATKLNAKSNDKSDITIMVHDLYTGHRPWFGFSIKSFAGQNPTLFNASKSTRFVYEVEGNIDETLIHEVNTINPSHGKMRARLQRLYDAGCTLRFSGLTNDAFMRNLQIMDSLMPQILAYAVLYYFRGMATDMRHVVDILKELNPLGYDQHPSQNFYEYKIKTFLTDAALGMTATATWCGRYDATGGYLFVREDGEIVCYHVYNRNEFERYLINHTKLETPGIGKHDYGTLYEEDGKTYIMLNLQVRWK